MCNMSPLPSPLLRVASGEGWLISRRRGVLVREGVPLERGQSGGGSRDGEVSSVGSSVPISFISYQSEQR